MAKSAVKTDIKLTSLIFKAVPEKDCVMGQYSGQALHGVFFKRIIGAAKPDLAARLHDMAGAKPFTVSSMFGDIIKKNGCQYFKPGGNYWFRITSYDKQLSEYLSGSDFSNISAVSIFNNIFKIARVKNHPLAKVELLADLLKNSGATLKIKFKFLSPTTFKVGEVHFPLPTPRGVFGDLAKKWGQPLPSDFNDCLVRVGISQFRIKSEMIKFKDSPIVGFTGDVLFDVKKLYPTHRRLFNQLADFAFYAGVGHKTTMGMGQVQVIK